MIKKILQSFGCGIASTLGMIATMSAAGYILENGDKFKRIFETIKGEFSKEK